MSCGIYKTTNTINNKVYIGQSSNIEERWKKHRYANDNFAIHKAIRKYGIENFSFSILEECPKEILNEREVYWTIFYNSLEEGYNMIPGGSNGAGYAKGIPVQQYSLNGEYVATYPSAKQASKQTGIQHTDICRCCRGEYSRAGLYQWKYEGSKKQIFSINKEFIRIQCPINQYALDGTFIRKYPTLADATKETGISKSIICNVCKGKGHTAGGFRWSYEGQPLEIKERKKLSSRKKVQQFDKQNNLVQQFDSLTDAANITGINCANIGQVCNGKRKTAGGYIWKYLE